MPLGDIAGGGSARLHQGLAEEPPALLSCSRLDFHPLDPALGD